MQLENLAPTIKSSVKKIFDSPDERKKFYKYAISVYANLKTNNLKTEHINACILQMYSRDADPTNGEAYIVPRRIKGQLYPEVVNGYKYAEKQLWQTGEFKRKPITFDLRLGEIINHNEATRDIEYKIQPVQTYEQSLERQNKKRVGWVSRFELVNGDIIEKFFWEADIEKHIFKFSDSYKAYIRDLKAGRPTYGIYADHKYAMMRKTAFMKTYRDYLPKTPKINIAIKNIDALNHATYLEIDKHAKPQYFDNPKFNEAKAIEKKEEQMNDDPMLKTAPKAAINKIFEFIKTLEKEKQKPAQAAILKKVQKFSELNGVKMARWYEMPWITLKKLLTTLDQKYNFKTEVNYPDNQPKKEVEKTNDPLDFIKNNENNKEVK